MPERLTAPAAWAALMYHELAAPGRALADDGAGYAVYCVARDAFREHLRALSEAGLQGRSIGGALASGDGTVAITFDDGCETDFTEAAPLLRERGFGATFFVIAGQVGRRGHLGAGQLRALAAAGFEIGSHSLTHRMLTALAPDELDRELAGSRARLEDSVGARVAHLSCPHGRWSRAIAAAAVRAGYETVSTSAAGLNDASTPPTRLRRIAVQRGATPDEVAALARGRALWRRIARDAALDAGKRLLGEATYVTVRERLLGRGRRSG